MKYSVQLTDTAKSDLKDIASYITRQTQDKNIAKKFVEKIINHCKILEDFPLSGAIPKDRTLVSFGYRFLVYQEYLIFYSVDDSNAKVYLNAVFNVKKDYTSGSLRLI